MSTTSSIGNSAKAPTFSFPEYGSHVPEDKDQWLVQTPYGKGLVIRTSRRRPRSDETTTTNSATDTEKVNKNADFVVMREIELIDWKQANTDISSSTNKPGQLDLTGISGATTISSSSSNTRSKVPVRPATLFTSVRYPSVPITVGSDVVCLFGRGRVTEIRSSSPNTTNNNGATRVAVIRLSSWRLAGRSVVTCYMTIPAEAGTATSTSNATAVSAATTPVQVVRDKKLYEMNVYEKVEYAQSIKGAATKLFVAKKYQEALVQYATAIDAVRYVQHNAHSNNHVRADLLVIMITCSNNAATCCCHVQQWDEVIKYTQNAIILLDAVYEKRGKKIHTILQQEGLYDAKVFGEWKVKSHMLLARGHAERGNIEQAMEACKTARDCIVQYTTATTKTTTDNGTSVSHKEQEAIQESIKHLLSNDKEIVKLYMACKERYKAQLKREKQRAQAMFGSNNKRTGMDEEQQLQQEQKYKQEVSEAGHEDKNVNGTSLTPTETRTSTGDGTRKNDDPMMPSNDRAPPKKKVTFSEEALAKDNDRGGNGNTVPWYEDELLVGGGAALLAGIGLGAFLVSRVWGLTVKRA